ncbi:lasso peptide biosynthesis B2 protein [Brevundimonas kwangchunensis]|uniref:Lasso peptide biosynthesis B2 protein n=1 Tax=Brevundimonas kwangchunensis TaxID=322163 RepID=A0ABN1H025_9CAUL
MTEEGQLALGVHAVPVGRDLILLDLAADDYLLFPDCGNIAVDGERLRGSMDVLLELASAELLHSGPARAAAVAPPPLPVRQLPASSSSRPRLGDVATFGGIWADCARRRPTLTRLAAAYANRSGRRDDLDAISSRAETFFQLLPFAPRTGACLFQAELLLRFLNAGGLDADWVFGVRAWPFLAHCWLQVDDVCVSQSAETLSHFHPILVI